MSVLKGIDHLVVALRDLDAGARFYEALGFQVGALNRHPWGTHNRLVQFPGAFLELITVGEPDRIVPHGPRAFSFGAFVRDRLARWEGLAMLVLDSSDAAADRDAFAAADIGDFELFRFSREGRRPDGTTVTVAFSLAFARDAAAPDVGFFVCEQHFPENFWNPAFQRHPNGATALAGATLVAPAPEAHAAFLAAFTGVREPEREGAGLRFPLARGRLDVMPPADAASAFGEVEAAEGARLAAFSVAVPDLDAQAARLAAAGLPAARLGQRLVLPAHAAFGVAIAFEPG